MTKKGSSMVVVKRRLIKNKTTTSRKPLLDKKFALRIAIIIPQDRNKIDEVNELMVKRTLKSIMLFSGKKIARIKEKAWILEARTRNEATRMSL